MACPHVSGTAALILGADSSKTPEKVRQELLDFATRDALTGLRAGGTNRFLYVGEGGAATPVPTPAPPPGSWTVTGSGCTLTEDDNCIQSNNHPGSYGNNEECSVEVAHVDVKVHVFQPKAVMTF